MSSAIVGVGAITPLGANAAETFAALCRGECAPRVPLPKPLGDRSYLYCPVPPKFVGNVGRHARLRRSGALSLYAATAAFDALADAGVTVSPEWSSRCAIVYGVSSGGVQYTRRFYHDIVTVGASAASPLLFPETVFNAPASHLAAMLGLDGKTYTLVGDSAVGLSAVQLADELLALDPDTESVLVVGTEESDWLLPDAFATWRLASRDGRCEAYGVRTGLVFGEGAAALLLSREARAGVCIRQAHPGQSYFSGRDALAVAPSVFAETLAGGSSDLLVTSANGTAADAVEAEAFARLNLAAPVYAPKPALGDPLGAGGVLLAALATLALRHGTVPGTVASGDRCPTVNRETRTSSFRHALVTTVGYNQAIAALSLEKI